jgi:hypothetical protein
MSAKDAVLIPPARPDIPILIAATRPRMLELTVRHADAWNLAWFGAPDERWAGARQELAAACAAVGRDPATLERTVGVNVRYPDLAQAGGAATADEEARDEPGLDGEAQIAAGLAAYADEGTGHLIGALEPTTPEAVARFAETARTFRARSGARAAIG